MRRFIMSTLSRLILIVLSFPYSSIAQWQRIAGQDFSVPSSVALKGGKIFVGTEKGVYWSTDGGKVWIESNSGLPLNQTVSQMALVPNIGPDTSLFAATCTYDWEGGGAFLSSNDGASWTSMTAGLPTHSYDSTKYALINCAVAYLTPSGVSNLVVATEAGVYVTTTNGLPWLPWKAANKGLPRYPYDTTRVVPVRAVSVGRYSIGGTMLYVGTAGYGVFRSTDGGESWISAGLSGNYVTALAVSPEGSLLFAGTEGQGLFSSSDQGINWSAAKPEFLILPYDPNVYARINALAAGPGESTGVYLYAATSIGLVRSPDNGATWNRLGGSPVRALTVRGREIFQVSQTSIWSGWGRLGYLLHSTDYGTTSKTITGIVYSKLASRVETSGVRKILAVTGERAGKGSYTLREGVLGSTNDGIAWSSFNEGFPKSPYNPWDYSVVSSIASDGEIGGNVLAGTEAGVYFSSNGGTNWIADTVGLSGVSPNCFAFIPQASGAPGTIVGTYKGVFLSGKTGTGWTPANAGLPEYPAIDALAVLPDATKTFLAATYSGVYRSTDNGTTWENANNEHKYINSFAVSELPNGKTNILAGKWWEGIIRSTDRGTSWMPAEAGLADRNLRSLLAHEGTVDNPTSFVLAGTAGGVFLSRNNGSAWAPVNTGLPPSSEISSLVFSDSYVLAIAKVYNYAGAYATFATQMYRRPIGDLVSSVPDTVVVISPQGGEDWFIGSSRPIRWSAALADSVKIEYSTNSGNTWMLIGRHIPAFQRVYPWTIPNTPSSSCKIRVSDVANTTDVETSQSTFSIKHDVLADLFGGVSDTSIASSVRRLEAFGGRFASGSNVDTVASWIAGHFVRLGVADVVADTFLAAGKVQKNIVATIPGRTAGSGEIIVGAHHDSYGGPGADDNASGTAAVLEMAKVIIESGYKPRATLRFITFAAEELGLIGSQNYATKAKAAGRNILLMQNYDMIGYYNTNRADRAVYVVWYPGAQAEASLDSALKCKYTSLTPIVTTQYAWQSDSWSFYEKGYKAVFNIEAELNPRYHSSGDSSIYMDFTYATEIVKSGLALLLTIDGNIASTAKTEVIPTAWTLLQNYPNPFNPTTNVEFRVKNEGLVKLVVYDILGREVAVLVNEEKPTGTYKATWDAKAFPSGVYFYRLNAGEFVETKKMVLLR